MDNGFGPLPNIATVLRVLARTAELRTDAAGSLAGGMLEHLAGLVDAHRRMAAVQPEWGDVELTWTAGRKAPVLSVTGGNAEPFASAWDDAQRHMLEIDLEGCDVLGAPSVGAVEHHEGLGAVFGRMAYLYTISFDRFVLDGPKGENRLELGRALVSYESLARDLSCGRTFLPSSFRCPD
ncbi:hypothetical protein IU470_18675 [Nocardia abscessus]|uniref:Uncharacterized protein n=1 Tax=Nocardia abscessus TaxID=120957 RepID=A0ABS0C9S5_9NOCA|nr:hypothetical protein [Nocardia abscessus]MBF6227122.1 hypothetical protein [Nocardia abscessus]